MIEDTRLTRQPTWAPWSHEQLVHERAMALRNVLDKSMFKTYRSALNSYLAFVKNHNLPVEPTEDTLSFFTVYISHHINPHSVNSYLSGIVHQLEPYFPSIQAACNSRLVSKTLTGCMRRHGSPTQRRVPSH